MQRMRRGSPGITRNPCVGVRVRVYRIYMRVHVNGELWCRCAPRQPLRSGAPRACRAGTVVLVVVVGVVVVAVVVVVVVVVGVVVVEGGERAREVEAAISQRGTERLRLGVTGQRVVTPGYSLG